MIRYRGKKEEVKSDVEQTDESILKAVEFGDREFMSKEELFKALKENEEIIVSHKKANKNKSENCVFPMGSNKTETIKEAHGFEEGFVYPIINTTKFMDSHNDVHLDGIWSKSVKEQQGKIFYVTDHELKTSNVIARPKDVEMSVKEFTFKDLGKDLEGSTQALMFKVAENKIKNEFANDTIKEREPIEHSVRMQYVKIDLALNSEAKEDKEFKKTFDKHINEIANKERAIELGYFWAVGEAKIIKEGSMVLFGSNDATPMMYPKETESGKTTQETEPLQNTQIKEEEGQRRRGILI